MDAGHAGELAGRLGDAVVLVGGPAEVDGAHEDEQEDRDRERELDHRLAALAASARPHGVTVTVRDLVDDPPKFETTRVTV